MASSLKRKIVVVGIGGASCSGKTLLAKHIRNLLPSSCTIIHQDDFVPPIEDVPYSKTWPDLQDWDTPSTCVLWPDFHSALKHMRTTGELPSNHQSHDHLNKQVEVDVESSIQAHWKQEFKRVEEEERSKGFQVEWVVVDGFVLYWDSEIVDLLDVKILLRVPHDLLKRRREERQVYVLQNPDDAAAGGVWVDPPEYFSKIVYPAYQEAHKDIYARGDVESGAVESSWIDKGLKVLAIEDGASEMGRAVQMACAEIVGAVTEVGTVLE